MPTESRSAGELFPSPLVLRLSVYASERCLICSTSLSLPPRFPLSLSLELGSYSLFQFRNLQGGKLETDISSFDCHRYI